MIARLLRWTRSKGSPPALFLASVLESTVFPVPIEMVMTPMMVADRPRTATFAAAVFLGCIAGSLLGYAVGWLAFETAGRALVDAFSWGEAYDRFGAMMAERGVLAVAAVAITPIPLVVASLGAGAAGMNVLVFLAVVGAMRGTRYFGIALLVHLLGDRAERLMERYRDSRAVRIATWGLTAALIGLLVWGPGEALFGAAGEGGS